MIKEYKREKDKHSAARLKIKNIYLMHIQYILTRLKSEILIISIIHEHEYKHDFVLTINEETC